MNRIQEPWILKILLLSWDMGNMNLFSLHFWVKVSGGEKHATSSLKKCDTTLTLHHSIGLTSVSGSHTQHTEVTQIGKNSQHAFVEWKMTTGKLSMNVCPYDLHNCQLSGWTEMIVWKNNLQMSSVSKPSYEPLSCKIEIALLQMTHRALHYWTRGNFKRYNDLLEKNIVISTFHDTFLKL